MKIAILAASFFPDYNGGAVRVDGLAFALHRLGHEVVIIVPGKDEVEREQYEHGVIYRIPYKKNVVSNIIEKYVKFNVVRWRSYHKYIFNILRDEKVDVVHCRQPFEFYYLGILAKRKLDIRVVFECHRLLSSTEYQLGNYPFLFYKVMHLFEKKLVNKSDAVIVLTMTGMKTLRQEGILNKIVIVPNATRLMMSKHGYLKVRMKKDVKMLLYAGTLRETEGLDILIKAFGIIVRRVENVKLVIIGDGSEKKYLQELAKQYGVKKDIIFLNQIPFNEIAPYYNRAFVFVHPRRGIPYHESFIGLKIYDAIATQLPIVTSAVGELGEMVQEKKIGILTKPDDSEDFAKNVVKIIEDRKLYKSIKTSIAQVAKKNTWENAGKILQDLYRSL